MKKRHITSIPVINHYLSGRLPLLAILLILGLFVPDLRAGLNPCPLEGDLECDSDCEDISTEDIDNVNPAWFSGCIRVTGTLYINENTYLNGAQFVMEPGSEVVVESGFFLQLVSCTFIAGCEELWKGINVQDDAALYAKGTYISGANAAIFAGDDCRLRIDNCTFVDNYIGIATAMPFDGASTPKSFLDGYVVRSNFWRVHGLLDPYSGHHYDPAWPSDASIPYDEPYAAVYLRNSTGFNVGVAPLFVTDRNEIIGLRNGVVIDELSTARVAHCDISDLLGTPTQSVEREDLTNTGIASYTSVVRIFDNTLDNLHDGVISLQSRADIFDNDVTLIVYYIPYPRPNTRGIYIGTATEPTSVIDNRIHEGDIGVFLDGAYTSEIRINDNTITSETDEAGRIGILVEDVRSNEINPGQIRNNTIDFEDVYLGTGIWLNIAGNIDIDSNQISFVKVGENAKTTTGIRTNFLERSRIIKHNDLAAIIGEDNYPTTPHFGIYYENSPGNTLFCNTMHQWKRGVIGSGMSTSTDLWSNFFNISNPVGFELRAPTVLGPQVHRGNEWGDSSHDNFGALISGSNPGSTAEASPFIIDNDNSCLNWPCPVHPTTDWFIDAMGSPPHTCESAVPDPPMPIANDYEGTLLNPVEFEDFGDEMIWMSKAWIYEAILRDDDLLLNTHLDSFFEADDTEPLGVLVTTDYNMHKPGDEIDELFSLSEEIMDSLVILSEIDQDLYDLVPDSNALRTRRDALLTEVLNLQDLRLDQLGYNASDKVSALSAAESALTSLTTNTDFEEFYRRALLYEIEWFADGPASISSGDWEEIQEIATLCSWEGGKAAAIAQSLLATARDSIVEPLSVCTGINPRNASTTLASLPNGLYAFPNPSSDGWNVLVPALTRKLSLVDVTGKQYLEKEIRYSGYLSSEGLPPGIYILQAADEKGMILDMTKLILQR